MIRRPIAALGVVAIALGIPLSVAAQQTVPNVRPLAAEACLDEQAKTVAAQELAESIRAAVRALPANRSSAEDIEATIVFTISQRNLCPGVARAALDSLGTGGTPAFTQAVAHARTSLIDNGTGTAGLRSSGGNGGNSTFFSPPVVGIGGGSATYSQ